MTKKTALQEIRSDKLNGVLIRSRARWIEKGEKPSQYFCSLENRNFVSKSMNSLISQNGEEISESEQITTELFIF